MKSSSICLLHIPGIASSPVRLGQSQQRRNLAEVSCCQHCPYVLLHTIAAHHLWELPSRKPLPTLHLPYLQQNLRSSAEH